METPSSDNPAESSAEQPLPPYERLENIVKELVKNGTIEEKQLLDFRDACNSDAESAIENLYAILRENGIEPDGYLKEQGILE